MKTRVLTAIVMVALMVPFFVWSGTVAFPILMALLGAVGAYEMQSCIGVKKQYLSVIPAVLVGMGLPFLARYVSDGIFGYIFLISFGIITYMLILSVFSGKKYTVENAALSAVTSVYISFGFCAMVLLRDLRFGGYIFLLPFVISWITDTFAYFSGMLFGKHKLIPSVSPKKTIEGAVGGVVFCVIFFVVYGIIIELTTEYEANYFVLAVAGVIVSVVSQIGDLIMSLIKRKFGIKDYGKIFPGHGGILDRCDSILAVTTVVAIICTFFDMFQ